MSTTTYYFVRRDNRGRVLETHPIVTQNNALVEFLRHLTKKERRAGINGDCPFDCSATHQYWIGVHGYMREGTNRYYVMQYCPLHDSYHVVSNTYNTVDKVESAFEKYWG